MTFLLVLSLLLSSSWSAAHQSDCSLSLGLVSLSPWPPCGSGHEEKDSSWIPLHSISESKCCGIQLIGSPRIVDGRLFFIGLPISCPRGQVSSLPRILENPVAASKFTNSFGAAIPVLTGQVRFLPRIPVHRQMDLAVGILRGPEVVLYVLYVLFFSVLVVLYRTTSKGQKIGQNPLYHGRLPTCPYRTGRKRKRTAAVNLSSSFRTPSITWLMND